MIVLAPPMVVRGCLQRPRTHAIAANRNEVSTRSPLTPSGIGETGGRGRKRDEPVEAAVVVTVTVTLVAEFPSDSGLGETVQVASAGAPVQVKATVPVIPPWPPTLKV